MTQFLAIVVQGSRVASGFNPETPFGNSTIALQKPFFEAGGVELVKIFDGTINASIVDADHIHFEYDYVFENLKWHPDFPAESFGLKEITIDHQHRRYKGYLYRPFPETKIGQHVPLDVYELLCEKIPRLSYGDELTLYI